ncbi:myosin-XVIIIa [Elysia marginata]|uniref:Myosin-XVIIIa n=1 Tax=Elysia marginata TaxID=1093978 RepID=A0AAV4JJG0_9GAST|nr:myosin-XVIIIa [Elysia marginata]
MFSFMKKDKEKDKEKKQEKKKKEKDEKKERKERQPMTAEEMSRLEEMKKGVFRKFSDRDKKRNSQKSPDGDRSDSGSPQSSPEKEVKPLTKPQPLPRQQLSSASGSRKDPPAVLPKPKKSILKGKAGGEEVSGFQKYVDLDDTKLLQKNTRLNEDMFTERVPSHMAGTAPTVSTNSRSVGANKQVASSATPVSAAPRSGSVKASNTTPTSATSTRPVSQDTSSELEEKEHKPDPSYTSRLKLPAIIPVKPPRVREIVVQRNQTGGFGFSLRKGLIPVVGGGAPRVVTFAEPGSGPASTQTGLLPGDRLVEVNGANIEDLSREAIVELIKKSSDTMTLKVQPIPELIELSIRPNKDGSSVDIQEDAAKSGTLKRTGSLRYRKGTDNQSRTTTTTTTAVVVIVAAAVAVVEIVVVVAEVVIVAAAVVAAVAVVVIIIIEVVVIVVVEVVIIVVVLVMHVVVVKVVVVVVVVAVVVVVKVVVVVVVVIVVVVVKVVVEDDDEVIVVIVVASAFSIVYSLHSV